MYYICCVLCLVYFIKAIEDSMKFIVRFFFNLSVIHVQVRTVKRHLVKHGMEWNGLEWNGMEWNGMDWNGMEWNGMEWSYIRNIFFSSQTSTH